MNKSLNKVLLIDDDDATNFLHRKIIEKHNFTKNCKIVETGQAALDYLTKKIDGEYPKPDLIFLDINMPIMNGWDFLKEYSSLGKDQKADVVLVMLTTSMNPDDQSRGESFPEVSSFMRKPLTGEMLKDILNSHFESICP